MEYSGEIFKGLGVNLIVTLLSSILPLLVGTGLTVLMHFTKRTALPKVLKYVTIGFECLAPAIVVLFPMYYLRTKGIVAVVLTLWICFLMYIPQRFEKRDSLLKNIVVNSIELISVIFLWSIPISYSVMLHEISWNIRRTIMSSYNPSYIFMAMALIFVVLAILNVAKNICKDLMK